MDDEKFLEAILAAERPLGLIRDEVSRTQTKAAKFSDVVPLLQLIDEMNESLPSGELTSGDGYVRNEFVRILRGHIVLKAITCAAALKRAGRNTEAERIIKYVLEIKRAPF